MYKLIKMSSPGWERVYNSRPEIEFALYHHCCNDCIRISGSILEDMLATPCGLEFDYVGPADNDEPPTLSELIQNDMDRLKA